MSYVEQHAHFALGNFINLTPTIAHIAGGGRVKVLFRTPYVKQCFLDCPFIEHIDQPEGERLFGSELICRKNDRPDYAHAFETVTGRKWQPRMRSMAYVDTPACPKGMENKIVLINGSGSERAAYVASKDAGRKPYMAAVTARPDDVVFVGSVQDAHRNPWHRDIPQIIGDIRQALGVISAARLVIANDTGLAHAAGAMNVPLVVLWKDTPFPRCSNMGRRTRYAMDNHERAVLRAVRTIIVPAKAA